MRILLVRRNHLWFFLLFLIPIFSLLVRNMICFVKEEKQNTQNNSLNYIFNNTEKKVYLTFDDGPTTKVTPKILDILKKENIPATFFIVGKHVKENPNLVNRAFDEGHFIANHGYNHNNKLLYKNDESFLNEILDTDKEIAKAVGVDNYTSHIFRFPNGFCAPLYKSQKKKLVKKLSDIGYVYIDWNSLNKDSERKYSNKQLLENLKKSIKSEGTLVILMHDTGDVNNTYDVLKESIDYLKSQDYEFGNFYDFVSKEDLMGLNK